MNSISMPYHLILASVIGLLIIGLAILFRKRFWTKIYWKSFWISAIVFLGLYTIIVGFAAYQDVALEIELNRYDLNGNGLFEGEECMSRDCKELMKKLTSDTGRNFSIITGGIFALGISLPTLLLALIIERLKKKNYTQQNL